MQVQFSGQVRNELPEETRRQIGKELAKIVRCLVRPDAARSPRTPGRPPEKAGRPEGGRDDGGPRVHVLYVYSGHTPDYDRKVILGFEFTHGEQFERHIVKIGDREKVEPDHAGWVACTTGKHVASRIFAPVRKFELDGDRVGVLYRDSFLLFGPESPGNARSQPVLLEEAVEWAALDNKPDPTSVERALAHVFNDLGVWFYAGSRVDRARAREFYDGHLRRKPGDRPVDVLARWQDDPDRRQLRRQAVWVLAGRDAPSLQPGHYLDPVDYVRWAMADGSGGRIPATLVGRSHGDLHARNVLVGIRRGEVQYPAVFDYGDMGPRNVLAWDFAKLETELKARLLPAALRDDEVRACLIGRTGLRKMPADSPAHGTRSEDSTRADRLAAFLGFEELLDHFSREILDRDDAERITSSRCRATPVSKINRLVDMLMRVRREASIWLGFERGRESAGWLDEFYFALAVYGLVNVRWRYTRPEQEAALVSSGVAVARMHSTPDVLRQSPGTAARRFEEYPSYRVPLSILHGAWKRDDHEAGRALGRAIALDVADDGRIAIRPEADHALPLIGHALLLETEAGNIQGVVSILKELRDEAREFGDYETLARIGRMFKDSGDQKWEASKGEGDRATRATWLQMYDRARDVYAEAFEATRNHYVGINAATLSLLTDRKEDAARYAREVARICTDPQVMAKDDLYWIFATEGEAALILGEPAERFYRDALAEIPLGDWGAADSMYKQVCRLSIVLEKALVEPVLEIFETSAALRSLKPNFLGREFPGKNREDRSTTLA